MFRLLKSMMFYTPFERRGIILLILLIALTVGGGFWWRCQQAKQAVDEQADSLLVCLSDSLQSDRGAKFSRRHHHEQAQEVPPYSTDSLFAFNPNQADSATLVRIGFTSWMARNLLKYRAKGGHFRRPEDLRKLYGMTDAFYSRIAPYITIPAEEQPSRSNWEKKSGSAGKPGKSMMRPDSQRTEPPSVYLPRNDSLYLRAEKYPKGTRIELNRADTTELKKIPGIGSYTARRIVNYRERLGGFVHMEQLREIRLNNEVLEPWFTLDTTAINYLSVNRLLMKQLLAHPYLNYRQSKAIMQYRERHGAIPSIDVMRGWEEFTANELRRIAPYLSFE